MPRSNKKVMVDSHVYFCFNLRRLREYFEWTQVDLGEMVSPPIPREQVADAEAGRNCPTLEIVDKYARAFNLPASALFEEDMEMSAGTLVRKYLRIKENSTNPVKKSLRDKTGIKFRKRGA